MSTQRYGYTKDGTLTICKAKPGNRGKGRCMHGEHVDISEEKIKNGLLQEYNEAVYAKLYAVQQKSISKQPVKPSHVKTKPLHVRRPTQSQKHPSQKITIEELEQGAAKLAENFNNNDWKIIKKFCKFYDREMSALERDKYLETDPVQTMTEFLESEDPIAQRLKHFIGDDVNTKELSTLIVENVGAMTKIRVWEDKRRNSLSRIVLTSVGNDMTKERYIASVLYFGGRCCYCNIPLSKQSDSLKNRATGEHLTPITPQEGPPGATRYGNMVLACLVCNNSRGNQPLKKWMSETDRIPKEKKAEMYARIESFRQFAFYSEYTEEETELINSKINELKGFVKENTNEDGTLNNAEIKNKIKTVIYDLRHELL